LFNGFLNRLCLFTLFSEEYSGKDGYSSESQSISEPRPPVIGRSGSGSVCSTGSSSICSGISASGSRFPLLYLLKRKLLGRNCYFLCRLGEGVRRGVEVVWGEGEGDTSSEGEGDTSQREGRHVLRGRGDTSSDGEGDTSQREREISSEGEGEVLPLP
jgi:hypothetical protein